MSRSLLVVVLLLSGLTCKKGSDSPAVPPKAQPPYDHGPLPAFSLVGHDGKAIGSKELAGKVWIANAFFTTCRSICPPLMEKVSGLTKRLRDERLRFVSITVDPDNDDVDVLAAHAASLRVGARWRLARTDWDGTLALVKGGFQTAMGKRARGDQESDITHSGKLFLVDRRGHLRGYYSTDAEGLSLLEREVAALLAEKAP